MEQQQLAAAFLSSTERTQLVHFCASIIGRVDVAEDLAQETLLEAWRHAGTLRDPERRSQWLFGIARNVCLRWLRKQGRDDAHLYQMASGQQEEHEEEIEQLLIDDYDIELDLERKELQELLDRALALLPPETRTALIQHYIDDSPLAEIAEQLGTTTNALAVRLQRGKLAMRRLLTQEMRPEFAAHRQLSESTTWEE
ncbi:MAG TPA: RNA polymerase sigma factor, partial [Ktedonobacteraceae bacterium]|nr:RNA polymerase sigma factor [Ktedonobacteraceae bacterium]